MTIDPRSSGDRAAGSFHLHFAPAQSKMSARHAGGDERYEPPD
jgi:hypothetical protein